MIEIRGPRTTREFQRDRDSCESLLTVQIYYHACLGVAHLLVGRTIR